MDKTSNASTINREDMLELTRRMTPSRNCFTRIAGAYMDEEGFIDGTFNKHFQNLSPADQDKNLKLAKAIPFADTNTALKAFPISTDMKAPGKSWQMLMALRECQLKNDALLYNLYEMIGEQYQPGFPYSILLFSGSYDIPLKGSDKESQWESEEVYEFLICAICPVSKDYESAAPVTGFLFPGFVDRSGDPDTIFILSPNNSLLGALF